MIVVARNNGNALESILLRRFTCTYMCIYLMLRSDMTHDVAALRSARVQMDIRERYRFSSNPYVCLLLFSRHHNSKHNQQDTRT